MPGSHRENKKQRKESYFLSVSTEMKVRQKKCNNCRRAPEISEHTHLASNHEEALAKEQFPPPSALNTEMKNASGFFAQNLILCF